VPLACPASQTAAVPGTVKELLVAAHRTTGLLLQQVTSPFVEESMTEQDPELVAGMLTAIQDFVLDSVSGSEGESLETIRMGEVGIVLSHGSEAILVLLPTRSCSAKTSKNSFI
jgi:hypothetical protein